MGCRSAIVIVVSMVAPLSVSHAMRRSRSGRSFYKVAAPRRSESNRSIKVEHEDFGAIRVRDLDRSFFFDLRRVAGGERDTVYIDASANDVHVRVPAGSDVVA